MPLRNKAPPKEGRLYSDVFGKTQRLPLLRILSGHQRWLNSNGRFGKRLDSEVQGNIPGLRFLFFDGYDLGLRFTNCDLDGIDFSFANIECAEFHNVSVRGSRFIGANLKHAGFFSCDVAGADFGYADVSWANFHVNTNHEEASFENARCGHTAFTREQFGQNNIEWYEESRRMEKLHLSPADMPPDAFWSPGAPLDSIRQTNIRPVTAGFGLVKGGKPAP